MVDAAAPGPSYFRGLNLTPADGEWRYVSSDQASQSVAGGQSLLYAEDYQQVVQATYSIDMLRPPTNQTDLLFYPGQLTNADRFLRALQATPSRGGSVLETADRVIAVNGRGTYQVQVGQSTASEDQLRGAGTAYPGWIDDSYRDLPGGYRSIQTEQAVKDLALRLTASANAKNPYDKAVAIEQYLRSTTYKYTLTPPRPPAGVDPESYFLFTSRQGYCQYFATAMADMLRSLGVPVRLVNGFGPGTQDQKTQRWTVKESDAHTWPEVYFPTYGWIPFEPTQDGLYFPIPRGAGAATGSSSDTPADATPSPVPTRTPRDRGAVAGGSSGGPSAPPSLRTWTALGAGLLLVLTLLYFALSRYLRPQTVAGVWRRANLLVKLAGVRPRSSETPIEFGDRVASEIPEAAAGIRQLAVDFAVAAYAAPPAAAERKPAVMADWGSLRPILLRRVASRLRP
jgi:transglutaminase-like putative cysteine protease